MAFNYNSAINSTEIDDKVIEKLGYGSGLLSKSSLFYYFLVISYKIIYSLVIQDYSEMT